MANGTTRNCFNNLTVGERVQDADEEQTHLKTIIGATEKKRRQKDNNWYNYKRDELRQADEKRRNSEVLKLLQEGYSQREVAAKTDVSREVVETIARGNGISAETRRQERDRQAIKMMEQGFSYGFIADALSISIGTVSGIARKNAISRKQGERTDIR